MHKTLATLAAVLMATSQLASANENDTSPAMPTFRVTPGGSAAYMYFPSSSDANSVLKVSKSGVFSNYEIDIQVDDGESETLCTALDTSCTRSLGPVVVKLSLRGEFTPGLPVRSANWIGDCARTGSSECTLAMVPGQNVLVSVMTGCDGSDYSLTRLGSDDVLCIGIHQNQYLLAAHKHMASGRVPKDRSGNWGNNSSNDGRDNMQALLNQSANESASSAHYCQGLAVGGRSGWYLPADNELNVVGSTPASELHGVVFSSTAGSTNKKSFSNRGMRYSSSGKGSLGDLSGKSSETNRTLCFQRVQ